MKALNIVSLSTTEFTEEELTTTALYDSLLVSEVTSDEPSSGKRTPRLNKATAIVLSGLSPDMIAGNAQRAFREEFFDDIVKDDKQNIVSFTGKVLPVGTIAELIGKRDTSFGRHVFNKAQGVTPESVIHNGFVFGGVGVNRFLANRLQVRIISGLQTDKKGKTFYYVGLNSFGILSESTNSFNEFDAGKGGVEARIKLYTDVTAGKFWFQYTNESSRKVARVGQALGMPVWYDQIPFRLARPIGEDGLSIYDVYAEELNALDQDTAEELRGTQKLFFEVFKTAKPRIIALHTAAKAAAAAKAEATAPADAEVAPQS